MDDAQHPTVEPGLYLHRKGGTYQVLGEVVHAETGERFVAYRLSEVPPQDPPTWIRTVEQFRELFHSARVVRGCG